MRLFRKTVAKAEKGKKNKKDAENQYEYVRKEYGFDYVPPSQYVPSHSLSEDDDDEENEKDDVETIEVQYQGEDPVRIIQPRSDLSGSVAPDDVLFVPKKSIQLLGRGKVGKKPKEVNPQQMKNAYRSRRATPPIPEEEEDEDFEDDAENFVEDRHYRPKSGHRDDRHRSRNPPLRSTDEEEVFRPRRPDRNQPEPRETREEILRRRQSRETSRQRSYCREDEVDDLDDLDIGRVQTAFSYNSDDSAQSLVEEQSKGSRYNARRKKRGYRPSQQRRQTEGNRFQERDLVDRAVVRSGSWRRTRKGWEFEGDDSPLPVREQHTSLEEYERPHYDRKHGTTRESRHELTDDYRRDPYVEDEMREYYRRDPYVEDEMREDDHKHSKGTRDKAYHSQQRSTQDLKDHRDTIDVTKKSHRSREQDWDSKEIYSRRRNEADGSYYATPSGKLASDYDASWPITEPRVSRSKRSKGILGRIRESVRGPDKKETRKHSVERDIRVSEARTHPLDGRHVKPSALFEQVQPSMRSDVSYENRRGADFRHREPDVPSTLPRTKVVSYPPRRDYGYGVDPIYDEYSEDGYDKNEEVYNSRHRPGRRCRRRHERPVDSGEYYEVPRRVRDEEYREPPPVGKVSRRSRENISTDRHRPSSAALPFETARNETPPLRHNPDRRRSTARHFVKGQHDHRPNYASEERGRYAVAQEIRYASLSSPRLIREHPTISDSVNPKSGNQKSGNAKSGNPKSGKGLRVGCY